MKDRILLKVVTFLLLTVLVSQGAMHAESSAPKTLQAPNGLLRKLGSLAPGLSPKVAELALRASSCAQNMLEDPLAQMLGIIDYSLPSTSKRFWLFNTANQTLLLEDYVAHGKNSGENEARSFSNQPGSLQSSLGLFKVGDNYLGKHGHSLRLIGLEPGINDLAFERAIVIHGADYVSSDFIRTHKRLGRSFGCPALAPESAQKVIKLFSEDPGFIFSYFPDKRWLKGSNLLNSCTES